MVLAEGVLFYPHEIIFDLHAFFQSWWFFLGTRPRLPYFYIILAFASFGLFVDRGSYRATTTVCILDTLGRHLISFETFFHVFLFIDSSHLDVSVTIQLISNFWTLLVPEKHFVFHQFVCELCSIRRLTIQLLVHEISLSAPAFQLFLITYCLFGNTAATLVEIHQFRVVLWAIGIVSWFDHWPFRWCKVAVGIESWLHQWSLWRGKVAVDQAVGMAF